MATRMTVTVSTARSFGRLSDADRERLDHVSRRRELLRRSTVVSLAVALALLVAAACFLVAIPLVTSWWLESRQATVSWNIDSTNWRQGGATAVSYTSRFPWMTPLGNSDLEYLHKLHRVESLDLSENDNVTSKGLASLRGLDCLRELNLAHMDRFVKPETVRNWGRYTDLCVDHLGGLPRLENLVLSGNLITDAGVAQIARMTNLKFLDLSATEVSDQGLVHLEGMKSLETVEIGATRVTSKGIAQLKTARPDLKINAQIDAEVEQAVKAWRGENP